MCHTALRPTGHSVSHEVMAPDGTGNRFVVHEHHARRLHWDLRLERDGVLVSWALPRGFPDDPKQNRLAVHTDDHPLEFLDASSDTPDGELAGSGTMSQWDRGTFEAEKFTTDKVVVRLSGTRVSGRFALFPIDGDNWMIHLMDPADPERRPMPELFEPMAATPATLPDDDENWAYELKWDGVRTLAFAEPGHLRLFSRTRRDVTRQYPEIRGLANALGARHVVLDGELVAFDDAGRPSFQRIQPRIHVSSDADIRRAQQAAPVAYVIFDLLYLDGESLLGQPYEQRRAALADLHLDGVHWQAPAYQRGAGDALLAATRAQHLEGIVAKRLGSIYRPGRRSTDWLKIKNIRRQEVVIGGWLRGQGHLDGELGALVVGYYDDDELRFAGKVGTGFDLATRKALRRRLESLGRDTTPFTGRQPQKDTIFVEPELVCEVAFAEWTSTGTMRQPSYQGLRTDKPAADVVREDPV